MVEVKNGAAGAVQRSHKVGQAGKNDFFGGLMLFGGFLNVDGLGIFSRGLGHMVLFLQLICFLFSGWGWFCFLDSIWGWFWGPVGY